MNSLAISGGLCVLCTLCVKAFSVVRNGFNTGGTENTENAKRLNFVLSSRKLEQRSELRRRKLFRACIR
jgi:hypothetical protein